MAGRAERIGKGGGRVRRVGVRAAPAIVGRVGRVGELFGYRSLIIRSSYIVLFVFLIFTSSKFFILLSDFDCISIC